jgi:hypothetical protein
MTKLEARGTEPAGPPSPTRRSAKPRSRHQTRTARARGYPARHEDAYYAAEAAGGQARPGLQTLVLN